MLIFIQQPESALLQRQLPRWQNRYNYRGIIQRTSLITTFHFIQ
jgi:hypothetical protein